MARLPEPGEAIRALAKMNARVIAATHHVENGSRIEDIGTLELSEDGELVGQAAMTLRAVYGDLYDFGEVLALAASMLREFIADLENGTPADSVASLLLQGVGIGVLIERARWEP